MPSPQTALTDRSRDPVARRLGSRLREARLRAGMTQQQLAGERYTKAYVSALENALVKPSMAALEYLATRLGMTAAQLVADDAPAWARLEADLRLAAGAWQAAVDAYDQLLESVSDAGMRAETMAGRAEALVRLDRPLEAAGSASQAVETFRRLGRATDAALAAFWLAAALHLQDNVSESRAILQDLLAKVRAGLQVRPDFKLRILMALASNDAREGNHESALGYLEEIRSLADTLDDRRRAYYLFDLARSYRETGDYEAAIRTGRASLALFESVAGEVEMALMENDLALSHLATGNSGRAAELAAGARARLTHLGDRRTLATITDTEAQIAIAREDWPGALELAQEAQRVADETGNVKGTIAALMTAARAAAALGQAEEAGRRYQSASDLARSLGRPGLLRRVLSEWADFLAARGEVDRAYALTREALRA